jgi:Protein of unknown function (DUF3592).
VICIIISVVLAGMIFVFAAYKIHYKNYITVKAEIIDMTWELTGDSETYIHFIHYKYSVDNIEYQSHRQFYKLIPRNIGGKEKIRYNPDNPTELENTFKVNGFLIFVIFFAVIDFGMIFALISVHRNAKPKDEYFPDYSDIKTLV